MKIEMKHHDAVTLSAQLHGYGPLVVKALTLAAFAHDGQFRKEFRSGVQYRDPYIVHPVRNALRVVRFAEDSVSNNKLVTLICASLLHDVIEDSSERVVLFYGKPEMETPETVALTLLRKNFGYDISNTVDKVTSRPNPADSGVSNNDAYLHHLEKFVVVAEAPYITKAMDLIDNAGSLKHLDQSDKRTKLAAKYINPVGLMMGHAPIVSNNTVKDRILTRLSLVHTELRDILK